MSAIAGAQQPQFRSGVELVQLDVAVMRGGRPVPGLTAADFVVTDNGVTQAIESAALGGQLEVTLVLDVSGSVSGERLTQLTRAVQELTRILTPGDRVALITFADEVTLTLPPTGDFEAARRAVEGLSAAGSTALRDAAFLAIQRSAAATGVRALTLLFSDGRDTASWLTESQVLQATRRNAAVIHAIRLEPDLFLDRITEAAGGRTWPAASGRDLQGNFKAALDDMRARYRLTYTPRGVDQPGWHEIRVRMKNGRADITARPGYQVGAERR